ncbi:EAL domain-containing protein [Campylobacter sp. 9BO]|uniref:putative bifunctional diguanylate cyclase/phosphodiesterase n=1 Tax=Campylobacter sp. 9BO TaxID=3424759 RepID=UPI003D34FE42
MTKVGPYFKTIASVVVISLFALYAYYIHIDKEDIVIRLSAVFNFCVAGVILVQILRKGFVKSYWLAIFWMIFTWAIADVLYAVLNWEDSRDDFWMQTAYAVPIFCLFWAFVRMYIFYVKFINPAQASIDTGTVFITAVAFILSVFLNDGFITDVSNTRFLYNLFYLFNDVFIFVLVFFILFSIKNSNECKSFYILLIAVLFYAIYNIFYSFGDILGYDFDNDYGELGFGVVFMMMMLASFYLKPNEHKLVIVKDSAGISILKKSSILIFVIVVKLFFGADIDYIYAAAMLCVTLFYATITFHVTNIAQTKELIEEYRKNKDNIKELIKKRKEDLVQKYNTLSDTSKYDYLTQAYNRPFFLKHLNEMIKTMDMGEEVSVYNIDLNRFKFINDTYGHYAGDDVLIRLVNNIKEILPKNGIVGRFSGDFIVIATKIKAKENDYIQFCNEILKQIRTPIMVDGQRIYLNASIGISNTQTSHIKTDDLLAHSQEALSYAKESISLSYVVYDEKIGFKNLQKQHLEILLENANFKNEFKLYYQPQYEISCRQLKGAEVLLRWISPIKGFISPGVFIPIAEESQMISKIGYFVSKNAMKQIAELNKKYGLDLKISINVSPRQLEDMNFVPTMFEYMSEFDIKPEHICFEITEISLMESDEIMKEALLQFKERGIDVALDDFGTGFSSLSYISKYAIDKIKIAKELVDNIVLNEAEREVVRAIIVMAKNLGIKTIAEGVETEAQVQVLRQLGCEEIQGYFWSKPLSEDDFITLIRGYSRLL